MPYTILVDGEIYEIDQYKNGDYKSLITGTDSFDTLKEAIEAANNHILKQKKKSKKY